MKFVIVARGASLLAVGCLFLLLGLPRTAMADPPDIDCAASQSVADSVLDELDNGRIDEMWANNVGAFMRSQMTKDAFLATFTGPVATLSAGVAKRTIVKQGPAVDIVSEKQYCGRFYAVTTKNGQEFFETVALVSEGGTFKLAGLFLRPRAPESAPAQETTP